MPENGAVMFHVEQQRVTALRKCSTWNKVYQLDACPPTLHVAPLCLANWPDAVTSG